ncbi:MAG: hypothetical protein D6775_12765, partial [Caldilineae bacterium]
MSRPLLLLALMLSMLLFTGNAFAHFVPGNTVNSAAPETKLAAQHTPTPVPQADSGATASEQPLYFFLFTHTEDPFNYELSEERYVRFVPEVEERAATHPDAHLTWTIMFQGSDAQVVADRNPQTGVVDLLRAANQAGVVEFGYHAHHDPTYLNRPQTGFSNDSSWEELVNGMVDWLGCVKDVTRGGCIAPTGGGISAVLDNFGPVQAVSGAFLQSDVAYEGGPTSYAVTKFLPDRLVGFGYPDHGPFASDQKRAAVAALMERLTPTTETSSTVFWADNVIKMTGGSPIDGTRGIDPLRGPRYAQGMLAGLDRSRPNVVLTGLASKYLYTKQLPQNSPTIYGYAHPDSPQLPPELLNSPAEKERFYQQSLDTLDYLLDEVLPANPGSRFIDSADLVQMVAPPPYWSLSPGQIAALAHWALANWTDRPPDWVSDGTDYYSLRDLFTLLVLALAQGDVRASGEKISLPTAYGPLEAADAAGEITLSRQAIVALATQLAPDFAPEPGWQVTPRAMIQPVYATAAGRITAAQLSYGMAAVYAADYAGTPVASVTLPATQAMPVTYDLLRQIGCLATCTGTAWSFKPARLQAPPSSSTPPATSTPTSTPLPTSTSPPTATPLPTSTATPSPTPAAGKATIWLPSIIARRPAFPSQPAVYTLFSINVQDFSYPAQSAAVLDRIIGLHEATQVPVDIYLTDTMAQIYADQYPDLLTRLRTSPVVAISYHTRPPRPYAGPNDWLGLGRMAADERYQTILRYETHAVDPVTGQTTAAPGGYQYVADVIGYPPYAASASSGKPNLTAAADRVFHDLGAQMTVSHGGTVTLGARRDGLLLRPEQVDDRLFEHVGEQADTAFEEALAQALAAQQGDAPVFIGIKMHDNDFFAMQSAWVTVYVQGRKRPPWDVSQ